MAQAEFTSNNSIAEIAALAYTMRKRLILAVVIPVIIGVLLKLFLPPLWRASVDLLVKTGHEYLAQGLGEATMTAPTSTKQEDINSEIELLTSRPVIEATINKIGLENIYPDLYEDMKDGDTSPGKTMDKAVIAFNGYLDVEPVKLSNTITVTFDYEDKNLAEKYLDEYIGVYTAKHAEAYSSKRTESYEKSIKAMLAELDNLEAQRSKIKLDNQIYDIVQQRAALINQRTDIESHIQDAANSRITLQNRVAFLSGARPKLPDSLPPAAEMLHARDALTDLQQSEAQMAVRYGEGNVDLQRTREQIKQLKSQLGGMKGEMSASSLTPSPLAEQVDQDLVMDRAELAPLDAVIDQNTKAKAEVDAELQRLEQADLALRGVESRIDTVSDNLKTLRGRYDQIRVEDDMDLERITSVAQVNKALAPEKPAQPKGLLYVGGGLLIGIFTALGMLTYKALTSRTMLTAGSIERRLGLPVLVSIPLMSTPLLPSPMKALPGKA
jgi:uncharacterized protein involved in exopolysaccharide biosynthesis